MIFFFNAVRVRISDDDIFGVCSTVTVRKPEDEKNEVESTYFEPEIGCGSFCCYRQVDKEKKGGYLGTRYTPVLCLF